MSETTSIFQVQYKMTLRGQCVANDAVNLAIESGDDSVTSLHLLKVLLDLEGQTSAGRVLSQFGITADDFTWMVDSLKADEDDDDFESDHVYAGLPVPDRSFANVFYWALSEAPAPAACPMDAVIDVEHLLLGVSAGHDLAARFLHSFDAFTDSLRAAFIQLNRETSALPTAA
jgi:hypothetical protein